MPLPARDAQLVQIREAKLLQSIEAELADAAQRAGDLDDYFRSSASA